MGGHRWNPMMMMTSDIYISLDLHTLTHSPNERRSAQQGIQTAKSFSSPSYPSHPTPNPPPYPRPPNTILYPPKNSRPRPNTTSPASTNKSPRLRGIQVNDPVGVIRWGRGWKPVMMMMMMTSGHVPKKTRERPPNERRSAQRGL